MKEKMKIEPAGEISQQLVENGVSEEAAECLIDDTSHRLQFYVAFSALRDIEKQENSELKGLLTDIFQKYIIRFEPGYLEKIKIRDYESEKVKEIVKILDFLTQFYISMNFTRKAIVDDLREESDLSIENCEYWADMIEKNQFELKLNAILTDLTSIKENM